MSTERIRLPAVALSLVISVSGLAGCSQHSQGVSPDRTCVCSTQPRSGVSTDHERLIKQAVDYLLSKGHSKFDQESGTVRAGDPRDEVQSAWVVTFRAGRHPFVVFIKEDGEMTMRWYP
jgi:hypothetical protein